MMRKRLAPLGHEYVVYTNRPPWHPSCSVGTIRIPRGKTFHDVRDRLPASVGKYTVVRALSVESARHYAAMSDIRCKSSVLFGRRRRRRG